MGRTQRSKDPEPWDAFQAELQAALAVRGVTSKGLAQMLGGTINEDTVANWRQGKAAPSLTLLHRISELLGMGGDSLGDHDPTYLFRRMGLIPDTSEHDVYMLASRVQRLTLRHREALERNAQAGRDLGVASIIRAAADSKEWAVGVWAAIEGPEECRMHVADRIDLRRLDGRPTSRDEVWADPTLHAALREAYAVPSGRSPRWADGAGDGMSSWSISHVGAPRSPVRRMPHSGVGSVLFYALTVESWVNDVADLFAVALGYGLATTRDIAMEATGISLGSTTAQSRRDAHRILAESPPQRRVWSHHAPPRDSDDDPFDLNRKDVPIIWLRESNGVLEAFAKRFGDRDIDELSAARDQIDRLVATKHPEVLVIDVVWRSDATERWRQVLKGSEAIYRQMRAAGMLAQGHRTDWDLPAYRHDSAARTYLGWLAKRLG